MTTPPPPNYSDVVEVEHGSTLHDLITREPSRELQQDFDLNARHSLSSNSSLLQVPHAMHDFDPNAQRKSRKQRKQQEDSVSLEMRATSNLVLLESMSFNFYGNPTVRNMLEHLPEDGKSVVNLSMVFLTEKFPPCITGQIWEFANGSSESDEADALASMVDYLDKVFHFWLFKGTMLTIATRMCFLLMTIFLWIAKDFKTGAPTFSAILACLASSIVYYRVQTMLHYFEKGSRQYRLWDNYYGLRTRCFCQLRGLITASVNGTVFNPESTNMFCGKRSTMDGFKTITYTFPVFVTPFVHLAIAWQLFASTLRSTVSDDYIVAEILPTAFLPALSILLHNRLWEHIRKGIRNEKDYRHNLIFMWFIHCVCCLFTLTSGATIFVSFLLYSASIFQLRLYSHFGEVLAYAVVAVFYFLIPSGPNIALLITIIFSGMMLCDVLNYYFFTRNFHPEIYRGKESETSV